MNTKMLEALMQVRDTINTLIDCQDDPSEADLLKLAYGASDLSSAVLGYLLRV